MSVQNTLEPSEAYVFCQEQQTPMTVEQLTVTLTKVMEDWVENPEQLVTYWVEQIKSTPVDVIRQSSFPIIIKTMDSILHSLSLTLKTYAEEALAISTSSGQEPSAQLELKVPEYLSGQPNTLESSAQLVQSTLKFSAQYVQNMSKYYMLQHCAKVFDTLLKSRTTLDNCLQEKLNTV